MRYDAATRLGIDYESLKAINPSLIYCHTRGFERGPRREPARQRPDRGRARGRDVGGRRDGRRGPADVESHVAGRPRQRLPVRDRHAPGASITATAPARGSSSTPRSSTRACSTRRTRGSPRTGTPRSARTSTRSSSASPRSTACTRRRRAGCASRRSPTRHWEHLCKALGRDDLLGDERFASAAGRLAHDADLWSTLDDTFAERTARRAGSSSSTPPGFRARSPTTRSRSACSTIPS